MGTKMWKGAPSYCSNNIWRGYPWKCIKGVRLTQRIKKAGFKHLIPENLNGEEHNNEKQKTAVRKSRRVIRRGYNSVFLYKSQILGDLKAF